MGATAYSRQKCLIVREMNLCQSKEFKVRKTELG